MVFNKILCLGFEIESGLDKRLYANNGHPDDYDDADIEYADDFFNLIKRIGYKTSGDGSILTKYYACEIKSGIYEIENKEDLNKIFEDFNKIKKYIKDTNKSCGIHIHISFKDMADYYSLLNWNFADNFLKKYEKTFKSEIEKSRLINSFCKKYEDENDFNKTTKQMLKCLNKGYRYKAINYNSFNVLKTIEFRLFPSTKSEEKFKDYITFLYDNIIKFLKKDKPKEKEKIMIHKTRKFNKDTEDEKIIITEEQINDNEFNNYVERKKKEKEQQEQDAIKQHESEYQKLMRLADAQQEQQEEDEEYDDEEYDEDEEEEEEEDGESYDNYFSRIYDLNNNGDNN
jgi:hypothetical protein|tara:strand:- start:2059 stop:3087 length:1029 start_codon:yes stop_codon:yes gene_type:complete